MPYKFDIHALHCGSEWRGFSSVSSFTVTVDVNYTVYRNCSKSSSV